MAHYVLMTQLWPKKELLSTKYGRNASKEIVETKKGLVNVLTKTDCHEMRLKILRQEIKMLK